MKKFREIVKGLEDLKESPVGMVGRTKDAEAMEHIENSGLEKRFRKIVKELGGLSVARQLLQRMTMKDYVTNVDESTETIEGYLRDSGFKIKSEDASKYGKELEFYNISSAKEAFEDLKSAGFLKKFDIILSHNTITYK